MNNPGQKRVVTFCSYVPQEMIAAVGLDSFRYAGIWSPKKVAASYLASNACSYTHCAFDYLSERRGEIAGIVFVNSCHAMEGLYQNVKQYLPTPCFMLDVPRKASSEAEAYFVHSLQRFKVFLEELSGTELTQERLARTLQKFNRDRLEASSELSATNAGPRILLSGNLRTPHDIIETIALYGGSVVVSDTCDGVRSNALQIPAEGDVWKAIASGYLQKTACPRFIDINKRVSEFADLVDANRIDGVVFSVLKFCPYQTYSTLALMDILRARQIPYLFVESEYVQESSGQLETRIQAFLECLL